MKLPKIQIEQITSKKGNTYLIMYFDDKNTHPSFEIYKLVQNQIEVAEEFEIDEYEPNRSSKLNTREMLKKIIENID